MDQDIQKDLKVNKIESKILFIYCRCREILYGSFQLIFVFIFTRRRRM